MPPLRKLLKELADLTRPAIRQTVLAPHAPVERITKPTEKIVIRAWWNPDEGVWEAVEGSHRLAYASKTDTPITIVPLQLHDALPNRNLDGSDVIGWDPAIQAVTIADALRTFRDWGKRPAYRLRVYSD